MPEPPLVGGQGSVPEMILAARELSGIGEGRAGEIVDNDPGLLTDMDRAVELVKQAVNDRVPIAIYGDYDADGVTACALLVRALSVIGVAALAYIPNRESEGYGLNQQALQELSERGAGLVITVDCGTTAVAVAAERPAGMRLLITDHHLPLATAPGAPPELAPADALVNPQRPGDRYPFSGLAGVGVAYKLVQALELAGLLPQGTAAGQLPLVALGTVADLMPLRGENRSLVYSGLAVWADMAPMGLLALARSAGIEGTPTSSDLGFSIGPRINAAGRMEDASLALECCLAATPAEATRAALGLEKLNRNRRESLAAAMAVARPMAQELDDSLASIVIGDESFPAGVVGLVAGRLAEEFQRPTFVYTKSGNEWKGSARGAPGLNVVDALAECAAHLVRYGGHRGAGGFSVKPDQEAAETFADAVERAVRLQVSQPEQCRVFHIDAQVKLSDCTLKLSDELASLGPFGIGNPPVLLLASRCRVVRTESFGKGRDHLRAVLTDGSAELETISFNRPGLGRHLPPGRLVDALFELDVDRWRGRERLRLLLRDLRPATESIGAA
ncbi:MAG: single-stranded-DNA-specific exonuclease RecJ [Candidatus Dormibacteria bacterium]